MYSVQTHEGPQIGQLIGGYIDIILKRVSIFMSFPLKKVELSEVHPH